MNKQEFIDLIGEDPEDLLGPDWENEVEEYLQWREAKDDIILAEADDQREDRTIEGEGLLDDNDQDTKDNYKYGAE